MQNKVLSVPDAAVQRVVEESLRGRRETAADEVGRLVEAALVLIQETGELEPKVSEIVLRAGVHNQAFYRHFRSKRALLVAVLDHGVVLLAGYLRHRMDQAQGRADAQVRAWIEGVLAQALDPDAAAATRPFVLGRGRLAEAYPREVARSEEQLTRLLQDALERARATGALPGADPARDAQAIYLLVMGWIGARMLDASPPTRADAEHLVSFALAGVTRTPLEAPDA